MTSASAEDAFVYFDDSCFSFLRDPPSIGFFNLFLYEHRYKGFWMHPSLCFRYSHGSGYGVAAHQTSGLKEGEIIARIPKRLILCVQNCSNRLLAQHLIDSNMTDIVGLTMVFLYEGSLSEESPFHYYLRSLRLPDVPRLWENEERRVLKGTEIDTHGEMSLNDIDAVYFGYVVPFIVKYGSNFDPPFLHVRLDIWELAMTVVLSRYFDLGEHIGIALIPMADTFNHVPNCEDIRVEYDDDDLWDQSPNISPDIKFDEPMTECICGQQPCICGTLPSDQKDPEVTTEKSTLDPGRGWVTTTTHKFQRNGYLDCIEIILTKDIIKVGELFTNYGPLSAREALSRFGFIIYPPITMIEMRAYLFDCNINSLAYINDERRNFWKAKGRKLTHLLQGAYRLRATKVYDLFPEDLPEPIRGDFVDQTIRICRCHPIPYTLDVWVCVALLNPRDFERLKIEVDMDGVDRPILAKWMKGISTFTEEGLPSRYSRLKMMQNAVMQRMSLFDVPGGTREAQSSCAEFFRKVLAGEVSATAAERVMKAHIMKLQEIELLEFWLRYIDREIRRYLKRTAPDENTCD